MENAVEFLVSFCCSSFLRKRSSKVPRIFHDEFHAIFHEALCRCKCPISWRFLHCRRFSLRKRKLRCSFWNAALQKLHCNIRFSAVRTSFVPEAALQQTKNCTATSKSLRCKKVALSCNAFLRVSSPPRLGTHVSDLLTESVLFGIGPDPGSSECSDFLWL